MLGSLDNALLSSLQENKAKKRCEETVPQYSYS